MYRAGGYIKTTTYLSVDVSLFKELLRTILKKAIFRRHRIPSRFLQVT